MALFVIAEVIILIVLYVILRPLRARVRDERERRYEALMADERVKELKQYQRDYIGITVSGGEGVSPSGLSFAINNAMVSMMALIEENNELRKDGDTDE